MHEDLDMHSGVLHNQLEEVVKGFPRVCPGGQGHLSQKPGSDGGLRSGGTSPEGGERRRCEGGRC